MKALFWFFLLFTPLCINAQVEDTGTEACQVGKVRSFKQSAAATRARLAYPGDTTIDVTYYGLDLRLNTTPNNLRGVATITLKSTVVNLSRFFLDFNSTLSASEGLRVDSVKMGSMPVPFLHAQNRLTLTLPQPLAIGQPVTLAVFYQGIPIQQLRSLRFDRHETTTDPVIWSLSEPYGAPGWFPCHDTPADKADSSSVRITAPAAMVSVSNGRLISTTTNADGTRTFLWRNSYPIAHYLISIAVSNYAQFDTPFTYGNQSMPVTHYIYPEDLPKVRDNLALTPNMLRLFTNRFGPYPFLREKYGHAQFAQNNGGMEHQTVSSMGITYLTPAVIAHELAHQWFGDKITCRDWQNIWLNEGFASYAEAIYAESVNGTSGYQTYINGFMSSARNARGSIYVQDISNAGNIFNGSRTYAKGATVLHMLRGVMGDSTFYTLLRTYASAPTVAYGTAVTEDFQAIAQEVYNQSQTSSPSPNRRLDYFFRQWIYGEGYPTYRAAITGRSNSATVRLQQTNATATNPASFTMPIQMRVQSVAGDTTVTVFNDQPDQTFTLPARGTVTNVLIDPNNWILKNIESTTTTLITGVPEPEPLALHVYPNPTSAALTIDFTLPAAGPVTITLTSLAGQVLSQTVEPSLSPGKHSRTLGLRGLSAGRYNLTVQTTTGRQSQTVLVP